MGIQTTLRATSTTVTTLRAAAVRCGVMFLSYPQLLAPTWHHRGGGGVPGIRGWVPVPARKCWRGDAGRSAGGCSLPGDIPRATEDANYSSANYAIPGKRALLRSLPSPRGC